MRSYRRILRSALLCVLVCAACLFGCSSSTATSTTTNPSEKVSAGHAVSDEVVIIDADAVASLPEDAYLVDTRTEEEYAEGHIPGALNASYPKSTGGPCGAADSASAFRDAWETLGVPKDAQVVLYCRTGVRASSAASCLVEDGYTSVSLYDGSWTDWTSDPNRPIER